MNKKAIALIVIIVILILLAVGALVYVLINKDYSIVGGNNEPGNTEMGSGNVIATKEEERQMEQNYPNTITGTFNLAADGKATLRADSGTYTFIPDQPKGVYEAFKVKNGDKVNVKGKILDGNMLQWFSMEKAN